MMSKTCTMCNNEKHVEFFLKEKMQNIKIVGLKEKD